MKYEPEPSFNADDWLVNETDSAPDLRARTKEFALRVIRMFAALPQETVAQVLGKQALRSGTSPGANYREAQRARSKAEFISKIGDCLKELDECSYWFELLTDSGTIPAPRLAPLQDECNQLLAIFTSISIKAKSSP